MTSVKTQSAVPSNSVQQPIPVSTPCDMETPKPVDSTAESKEGFFEAAANLFDSFTRKTKALSNDWLEGARIQSLLHENPELQQILDGALILEKGAQKSQAVGMLQDLLRKAGASIDDKNGAHRGIFGPQTKAAVEQFQRNHNLEVNGKIDSKTLEGLIKYVNQPLPSKDTKVASPLSNSSNAKATQQASLFNSEDGSQTTPKQKNDILSKMTVEGDAVFRRNAQLNMKKAKEFQKLAVEIGQKYNLPPALVLSLMNRETRFGVLLKDGWGDNGNAYGVFQVDKNNHEIQKGDGPYSWTHIDQAMGIFVNYLNQVKAKHPDWSEEEQLAGTVLAYNAGPRSVVTRPSSPEGWAQLDVGSYNDNYSRDVWAGAQYFAENLDWSSV